MCGYMLMVTFYTELPRDLGLTYDQKMTKLMVTQELVDKAVCPSYVTHQKAISYSWILTITRAYSLYKSTSSTIAFNARFPANRDQLRTDLRLKTILDFLDLWAVIKLLSSKCKLMFISMSRSNWYTSKKKCIIGQVIRVTCDRTMTGLWPSHTILMSIGINSGLRTTTTARPPWYTCDQISTDLWCFATD